MKKFIYIFLILLLILISSCKNNKKYIKCDDLELELCDTAKLNIETNIDNPNLVYIYDQQFLLLDNMLVIPLKPGSVEVIIRDEKTKVEGMAHIIIKEPILKIEGPSTLLINEHANLTLIKEGFAEDEIVSWSTSNKSVVRISPTGLLTAAGKGNAVITATIGDYSASFNIEVTLPTATSLEVEFPHVLELGNLYDYKINVEPDLASSEVEIEIEDGYLNINKSKVEALKTGEVGIKIKSLSNQELFYEDTLVLLENEAPKITKKADFEELLRINYNDKKALLQGLEVSDNSGLIKDEIILENDGLINYGINTVIFSIEDYAGNKTSFERDVEVVYEYHTKFIGHAGCTYAVPNTEDAFLFAASVLKYQALECDLQVTSDGVYVLNHDSTLNGKTISNTTYEDLLKETIRYSNYEAHICTLDRYLEICKEYNLIAVIEIKGSSPGMSSYNQDKMKDLMEYLIAKDMYDSSIILSGIKECLMRIRFDGYDDIRLQYLVNSCEGNDILNFCKTYNCDISTNVTYGGSNRDIWLDKYHEAGLEISVWTFSGAYSEVQKWIDKGVEYVTCDSHYMEQLDLK